MDSVAAWLAESRPGWLTRSRVGWHGLRPIYLGPYLARAVAPDSSSHHGNEGRPTRVIDYELPNVKSWNHQKKNKSATQHI